MNPTQAQGAKLDEAFASGDEELLFKELTKYVSLVFWLRQGIKDEDFVAETVAYIMLRGAGFRGDSNYSTWAFKVVVNKHLNWLRKQKKALSREANIDEAINIPSEEPSSGLMGLQRHFGKLSSEEQDILKGFLDGKTQWEIAQSLGQSKISITRQWKEIITKLRRYSDADKSEEREE